MFTEYEYTDRRYISYYCQPSNSPAPLSCRATVLGYIIAGQQKLSILDLDNYLLGLLLIPRSKIQDPDSYLLFLDKIYLKLHNFLFITDLLLFLLTALS